MDSPSVSDILGEHGPFAAHLDGFAPRAQQQALAQAIYRAFTRGGPLIGEAGTGVGKTQASLFDIHPTALAVAGLEPEPTDIGRPGRSLLALASAPCDRARAVLSEYHDGGSLTGFMMLREGRWKYIVYAGFALQLFDLEADSCERHDLGLSGRHRAVGERLHARMCREFGDPEAISRRVFADQARRIAELGGPDGIYARTNYDHTPL